MRNYVALKRKLARRLVGDTSMCVCVRLIEPVSEVAIHANEGTAMNVVDERSCRAQDVSPATNAKLAYLALPKREMNLLRIPSSEVMELSIHTGGRCFSGGKVR